MQARKFDLIAFDWDGTLFDSTRLIARCIQSACADLGTTVPSDRDASFVIGLGLGDALWVLGEYVLISAKGHELYWETPLSSDLGPGSSDWE